MIGDYCGLQRQLQRRLKRATDGSGWKEKAPACVQSMDISLAFKMGDMANISVKSNNAPCSLWNRLTRLRDF